MCEAAKSLQCSFGMSTAGPLSDRGRWQPSNSGEPVGLDGGEKAVFTGVCFGVSAPAPENEPILHRVKIDCLTPFMRPLRKSEQVPGLLRSFQGSGEHFHPLRGGSSSGKSQKVFLASFLRLNRAWHSPSQWLLQFGF